MVLIFVSLFFTLLFSFLSIMILNISIYIWETKKVNHLTERIHHSRASILNKNNVDRKFISRDWSVGFSKQINKAANNYEKTLLKIEHQDYPNWLKFLTREFENLRRYTWKTLLRLWNYILQLSRPYDHKDSDQSNIKEEFIQDIHKEDIQDFVHKVTKNNQKVDINRSLEVENLADNQESLDDIVDIQETNSLIPYTEKTMQKHSNEATIGLGGKSGSTQSDNLFEKLEAKILKRLQNEGLNNYDIWLQLGILYEKYGEIDKAREVYALVMKQSDGKEKELARDRLIGI